MEEKKLDLNSIIGFGLIFLILLWIMFTNEQKSMTESESAVTEEVVEAPKAAKVVKAVNDSISQLTDSLVSLQAQKALGVLAYSAKYADNENKPVVLESELLRLVVSPKGGYVQEAIVKPYERFFKGSGEQVVLIKDGNADFNIELKTKDNRVLQTRDLFFEPNLQAFDDRQVLTLRLKASENQYLEYVYTLRNDSYLLDFSIRSQGFSDVLAAVDQLPLEWKMKSYRNEKSISYENRYTELIFEFRGGKDDYLGQGKPSTDRVNDVSYVAFKQHFFSSVLLTDQPFKEADLYSFNLVKDEAIDTVFTKEFKAQMPLALTNGELNYKMNWYYGPTDFKALKEYGRNLDAIVPIGWGIFGWINRFAFIPTYDLLISFLPYGIAIIVLTILVRIVMSPVTYKSYLSQAKMKVLRPEMNEISEKFAKDPMKKQQEMMKLYQKAGVNPMAGCLPALLQIPVFYALYCFFPSAFSLRQKSFLWADDLSSFDSILSLPFRIPFYGDHVSLFPILASISIFFYMKMTTGDQAAMSQPPQEGMPDMAKIMKIMIYVSPIMLMIFFNNFASGLSLYYFISNTITIGIMLVIKNYIINEQKIHLQIQENKQKPRKMNKFQQRMQEMMEQAEKQKNLKK